MKECPKCGTVYTDQTLSFCLSDGASLVRSSTTQETVVLPEFNQADVTEELNTRTTSSRGHTTESTTHSDERRGVSPAWVFATFALIGVMLGGILVGIVFYSRDSGGDNEHASSSNKPAANSNAIGVNANTSASKSPRKSPTPRPTKGTTFYKVTRVKSNDVLYIRPAPGNLKVVAGKIPPNASGIRITGSGKRVGKSIWVPISYKGQRGWVNRRFLAQTN